MLSMLLKNAIFLQHVLQVILNNITALSLVKIIILAPNLEKNEIYLHQPYTALINYSKLVVLHFSK